LRDTRIEPAQSILLWCVLAVDAAVVSREHPCVLLVGPGYQLGVFTPSAGRFEPVLTPEPQRQPDTDRGQDEQDHRPVGHHQPWGPAAQRAPDRNNRNTAAATTPASSVRRRADRAPLNC
jgi:hypothetical protein